MFFHLDIFQDEYFMVSRCKDPGPIVKIHPKSKKKHRLFRFSISIHKLLIVLYSMVVISHWLMFVAIYVILSKINVTNKVGQSKVSPLVLNMSFICDKTSLGKGGMIGTVYRNYHCPALIITFIFPDLPSKILQTSSQECACPTRTYACLIKHYSK